MYTNVASGHNTGSSAAVNITNLDHVDFRLSTNFVLGGYFAANSISVRDGSISSIFVGPRFHHNRLSSILSGLRSRIRGRSEERSFNARTGGRRVLGSTNFSGSLPVSPVLTYMMALTGVYSAAGLTLTGTLSNDTDTLLVSGVDSSLLTGTYFGYQDELGGSTQTSSPMLVSYDNFSISVPEPDVAALLMLGASALLFVYRHRHRR